LVIINRQGVNMDEDKFVPFGDKLMYGALGLTLGAIGHRFIGAFRVDIEKKIKQSLPAPEGFKIGTITTFLSLMFPENEVKYFIAGLGTGITVDDVIWHAFQKYKIKKIDLGDTEEWDYVKKYSSIMHVDERLPLTEKEAIILPYFPSTIIEQRPNPLQHKAIERVIKENHMNRQKLSLTDMYWLQQFFLFYGQYEANEGLWGGHDRIRTLAKLLRVRDSGNWERDGHSCFKFDCDDGATCVNQILDYYHYPTMFGLISQKSQKVDGVHPLHHIFPLIKAGGRIWLVETIKSTPIVPIEFAHEIFNNLQRFTVVTGDGVYYDFDGWKKEKIKSQLRLKKLEE